MCDAIILSMMLSVKLLTYILSYIESNSHVYVVFRKMCDAIILSMMLSVELLMYILSYIQPRILLNYERFSTEIDMEFSRLLTPVFQLSINILNI